MTKKGRPDKTGIDARQLLITAARKKFVSKSYDKVSIRELAQSAGVNSAMIKYYFQNKEGLYKAMIMEVTGQIMSNLKLHLQSANLDNMEDFFRSAGNFLLFFEIRALYVSCAKATRNPSQFC